MCSAGWRFCSTFSSSTFPASIARLTYDGVNKYLKLYYRDRDKLPPDETNGNQPLVSTYEVAWYSWRITRDEHIADSSNRTRLRT